MLKLLLILLYAVLPQKSTHELQTNVFSNMDIADYMETEYNSYGWNESDVVRSEVYEREKRDSARAGSYVQQSFGKKIINTYKGQDFSTFGEFRSGRPQNERSGSQEDNRNYRFEHDGSGNAGKTGKTINLPQGHSPAGFCALFIFANGAVLLQYGYCRLYGNRIQFLWVE